MPTTPLSLITYSNGSKPAHWAIYLPAPSPTNNKNIGKILHVTGNPAVGFFLQFKRNYNLDTELRRYQVLELGGVDEKLVRHGIGGQDREVLDTTARDQIEGLAVGVEPPGSSERPFSSEARNCQDWIADFVDRVVAEGWIDEGAKRVLEGAPRKM